MGRSPRKSSTYTYGYYKLRIERLSLAGNSFGIRVILFRRGKRISVWPGNGWKQYLEDTDSSVVTRDIVQSVKFPGLNVGELYRKVEKLLG